MAVNGKQKGSSYERWVCKQLSSWVSGGTAQDLFWRSALSGGRATVSARAGKLLRRQAGDITATAPEAHALTEVCYLECKHYRSLAIERFFLEGKGTLAEFWLVACADAKRHKRTPVLIARQNRTPDIVVSKPGVLTGLADLPEGMLVRVRHKRLGNCEVRLLAQVLGAPFKRG